MKTNMIEYSHQSDLLGGKHMFCSECGTKIPDGSVMCPECTKSKEALTVPDSVTKSDHGYDMVLEKTEDGFILKTGSEAFGLLILSVFFFNASFLFKSIFLKLSQKPLSPLMSPLSTILSFSFAILFLLLYFKKETGLKASLPNYLSLISSTFLSIIAAVSFISIFSLIIKTLYLKITATALDSSALSLLYATGYFVLLLILQFFILTCLIQLYASSRGRILPGLFFKSYMKAFSLSFRKLPSAMLINITALIIFLIFSFLEKPISNFITTFQSYGFLAVYLQAVIWASILAYIIQITFNFAKKHYDLLVIDKEASSKSGVAFLVTVLILLIPVILLVMTTHKPAGSSFGKVLEEIQAHDARGDLLRDIGHMPSAINEYNKALSKAYSLRGYLYFVKLTINADSQLRTLSTQDLKSAESLDLFNGYISFFRAKIFLLQENQNAALAEFQKGLKNGFARPEALLEVLKIQKSLEMKAQAAQSTDRLIRSGIFHNELLGLYDLSLKDTDSYLKQLDELISLIEPKQVYSHYEKLKYHNHYDAVRAMTALRDKYPDDPAIRYFLSLLYAEYTNEANNYVHVLSQTDALNSLLAKELSENDKLSLDVFTASMYMQANEFVKAEKVYSDLYKENKEDVGISETYMYLLVKNKKFDEALSLYSELSSRKMHTLSLTYLDAITLLNLGRYEDSLKKASQMTDFGSNYTEEYDRFLYAYSLAYVNAIKNQEHIDTLLTSLKDHILFDYIMGLKGWKDKNSDTSNIYMLKVINSDDRLGYALYAIGVNYYEMAIRTGSGDFDNAIKYYLDSLKIVPDHVEGYFALGHCYLKAGMKPEALRAFRKVVDLVPYEDHRVDPYGMIVHAQGEISKLVSELGKGGN